MKLRLLFASVVALSAARASAATLPKPQRFGTWGVELSNMDKKVKPGDDFDDYVNGAWTAKAVIPPDQGSTGAGYEVYNLTQEQIRAVIESAPTTTQLGALYQGFMDEALVEKLDEKPLKKDLAEIAALKDRAAFTKFMGSTAGRFGIALFGPGMQPDPKQPDMNTLWLSQGGIGLPDRDFYLVDTFKPQVAAYRAFIERALAMVKFPKAKANADAVLAFETAIAKVSWAQAERRDIDKINNPMSVAELQAYAPGIDWEPFFAAANIGKREKTTIVQEKTAIRDIAALYAKTPLETLKAWETFHVVEQASPFLSKRFVDSRFEWVKTLNGVTTQRPRWKRAVATIDGSLGELLGRAYVEAFFPATSKAMMVELVANLKTAMAARIQSNAWMSASTKQAALEKLAKMDVMVGYPDKWRDYSGLKIDRDDLYGNMQRSGAFEWAYQLSFLDKPVDHKKWDMTPQTVNAYNGELENKIVFPAGILQPPFFDPQADPAVNYGAIGSVIGHEISHGFDDQGRKIDSNGAVKDWWAPADAQKFNAQAKVFGAQYDTYEPVPGMHVKGDQTMGENIADMAGILVALDAYHTSLQGKPAKVIDGLTGDQRFFLGYAAGWRAKIRDDAQREQMAADPHTPDKFRVIGPLRNVDSWYDAFQVTSGKYYLKPAERVHIW